MGKRETPVPRRQAAMEPKKDPTDRLPSLPPEGTRTKVFRVVNVRTWFDNWTTHNEGMVEDIVFPIDAKGNPIFPGHPDDGPHVVLEEDYVPPVVDLPGTNLDRRRQQVRGGASGMPSL